MKNGISDKKEKPPEDTQERCIWMSAGVISFKLCPLSYECEHCEFDEVMRHQFKDKISPLNKSETSEHPVFAVETKESEPFFTFSPRESPPDFHLHLAHLWAKPLDGGKWKIGIDDLLAYILPKPIKVEFCDAKKAFVQNKTFGKILTQVGTLFLNAPLSGKLILENPALTENPALLQDDPLGEGWLAQIEWYQDTSELDKFYTSSQATKFLEEEGQHLKHFLKYRGVKTEQIGQTSSDGGVNIKYLHQVLPEKICMKLAQELMVLGKTTW